MTPLVLLLAGPLVAETTVAQPTHPLRLGVTSVSAVGVTHGKFFNQLAGARLEYRFTPRFAFGAALAYANLKGTTGRVHNVLPEATLEYRLPVQGEAWGLPVRAAWGFLPKNGPTLRLGVGVDCALSSSLSLELIPVETMIWVTRERPEVSMNGSLSLRYAL